MTEQLPRMVEPHEIRVGDYVSQTVMTGTQTCVTSFWVCSIDTNHIYSDTTRFDGRQGSWEVLDRPAPPCEVGSRWRDPVTEIHYVFTDRGTYINYVWPDWAPDALPVLSPEYPPEDKIIARLIEVSDPS